MLRGSSFAGRVVRQRAAAAAAAPKQAAPAPPTPPAPAAPAAPKVVDWQSAVGPFNLPSYSAKWRDLLANAVAKKDFTARVPAEVGSVDFARYEKLISDKEAVKAIKAEYEAAMSSGAEGVVDNSAEVLESTKKLMGVLAKWEGVADTKIAELKAEHSVALDCHSNVVSWDLKDFYKAMPGLEQQLVDEFEQDKFWLTEEEEKIAEIDYKAMTEKLTSGVLFGPGLDAAPAQIGDLDVSEYLSGSSKLKDDLKADLLQAVADDKRKALSERLDAVEKEWQTTHPELL